MIFLHQQLLLLLEPSLLLLCQLSRLFLPTLCHFLGPSASVLRS